MAMCMASRGRAGRCTVIFLLRVMCFIETKKSQGYVAFHTLASYRFNQAVGGGGLFLDSILQLQNVMLTDITTY